MAGDAAPVRIRLLQLDAAPLGENAVGRDLECLIVNVGGDRKLETASDAGDGDIVPARSPELREVDVIDVFPGILRPALRTVPGIGKPALPGEDGFAGTYCPAGSSVSPAAIVQPRSVHSAAHTKK